MPYLNARIPLEERVVGRGHHGPVDPDQFKERTCLKCDARFISESIYNRVCVVCTAENVELEEGWDM